jgi:hypothetical protein
MMIIQKLYTTNTTGQFTEKKLLNCRSSNRPSLESNYRAKSQASYLKMKETFLPGTEAVILLDFQTVIHFYMKMLYTGSTGKLSRSLSTLLFLFRK